MLIRCQHCEKPVSTKSPRCPYCQTIIEKTPEPKRGFFATLLTPAANRR